MKQNKAIITILAIQITEVLGFTLVLPFLPLYASDLGANPFQVGLIMTLFSLFQFFSAPIMGKLSDVYGRKPFLLLSQFSTFISFIILGFAKTLPMIYLSRIIDGLLGSNMSIAQAYMSDISDKKSRTKLFAFSGIAFSIGFMIGPALGGFLANINYAIPAFLAAGVSLVTIVTTVLLLKETVNTQQKKKFVISAELFDLKDFKKYFQLPQIKNLLWIFLCYILAHVLWTSNFSLFINKKIGLEAQEIGFTFAFTGMIMIILRGLIIPKLLKLVSEDFLKKLGLSLLTLGMFLTMLVSKRWMLYPVLSIFALGSGLTRPILMGSISKTVKQTEQGAVMGLTNSLGSISQIIGPLVGGLLLTHFPPFVVLIPAVIIMLMGLKLAFAHSAN